MVEIFLKLTKHFFSNLLHYTFIFSLSSWGHTHGHSAYKVKKEMVSYIADPFSELDEKFTVYGEYLLKDWVKKQFYM